MTRSALTKQSRLLVAMVFAVVTMMLLMSPERSAAFKQETLSSCLGECSLASDSCYANACILCIKGYCRCSDSAIFTCHTSDLICQTGCNISFSSDIDSPARVSKTGRHIAVSVPVECPEVRDVTFLRVTVTQHVVGAIAEGSTRGACTGETQRFIVDAEVLGNTTFGAPGIAQVCAVSQIGLPSQPIESKQWCRDITLIPEGFDLIE